MPQPDRVHLARMRFGPRVPGLLSVAPRSRYSLYRLAAALSVVALLAGCGRSGPAPRHLPAVPVVHSTFVGNARCESCHVEEARLHRKSRHAITLREMDRQSLGSLAPPVGTIPDTTMVLETLRSRYRLHLAGDTGHVIPMSLVVGSGKTGMTYVAFLNHSMLELRKSYFPSLHAWYMTPGQESLPVTDLGMLHDARRAQTCLLCHATVVPSNGTPPQQRFFGVGCESCHGPGSAHVAAVKAHNWQHLGMDRIGSWGARRINEACGKCHRTAQMIDTTSEEARMTNRFQPYGLMLSRCFLESGNTLSCLTCHDPHAPVSTDLKQYETDCLKCHGGPGRAGATAATTVGRGKVCPVNPHTGCIGCHMPARPALPDSGIPTFMADHYIRVFPAGGS